jgi:hypothetical protein
MSSISLLSTVRNTEMVPPGIKLVSVMKAAPGWLVSIEIAEPGGAMYR